MRTKHMTETMFIISLICALFGGCASNSLSTAMPELNIPMSGNALPDIEYSIELKDMDNLPQAANVYKFIEEERDITSEVLKIAKLFDVFADPSNIQHYDDFVVFDNGDYLIDYEVLTGMWSIRNISENVKKETYYLPTDAEAVEIAREFLIEKGLYNERFTIDSVVTQYSGSILDSTYAPCFKTVYFYPVIQNHPILGVSRIIVKVNASGQVVEIMNYYKDFELYDKIELASPTDFIEGIKDNSYSSSIRTDALSAKIIDVQLGYWEDAGSFKDQPYLQPVWIFLGESTNADGTVSNFDIVVQAAKHIEPMTLLDTSQMNIDHSEAVPTPDN